MSERALPPYTYTPGVTPHPIRDPAGHSHGFPAHDVVVDAASVDRCCEFRRGIELFQHGFYWEAHEAWEAVWHALARTGPAADFLKGLIKLAAAGVKAREGNSDGVQRHARRAVELLSSAKRLSPDIAVFTDDRLVPLVERAANLATAASPYPRLGHGRPVIFWPELGEKLDRL